MRVVLVTGGTRGIGAAIAAAFAESGDTVVVCGRRPPQSEDGAAFIQADLRESETASALVDEIIERFGRLDVLVNNAGGSPPADTAAASPRFSEAILRLNLLSPLLLCQQAHRVMPTRGVIINISSVAGMRAAPTVAAYGAAKAGLLNLTQTLAVEWAPRIRVNAISPGIVASGPLLDAHGVAEKMAATVPLGRLATPTDVASACLWLASDDASYITGANLVLDGGGDWPAFLRPGGHP